MKKIFILLAFTLVYVSSKAQNVYFREDFSFTSTGPSADPAAATTVNDYTSPASGNAIWKFYGVWLTTGTACEAQSTVGSNSINRHVRSTSNTSLVDTAYIITPALNFGINTLMFYRSRVNRRYTIWTNTTYTTDPANASWTLASVVEKNASFPSPLCVDSIVNINRATARVMMFKFERNLNSDIDSMVITSTNPITPVKYAGINAQLTNGIVKLSWSTVTEVNTNKYVIEKSADGVNFSAAGEIAASNSIKYGWIDNTPYTGINYYRVKGVDKDGVLSYSSIVSVNGKTKASEMIIAPNPVKGSVMNVQLNNFEKATFTLNLINSTGQNVYTTKINNEGGFAMQNIVLPSNVKSGMYKVQLVNGSSQTVKTIIVQ
jgi:Secretion system C-terminal sorting domain